MLKSKSFKIISFLIKATIVGIAFYFLYRQVFIKHDFNGIMQYCENMILKKDFMPMAIFVFTLMLFNWGIEAIKWRMMVAKIEKISFFTAIESIFAGLTVSFFTPNRIGEFGGRIFFLEKADRVEGALISMLGGMSQLMITVIAGGMALIYFLHEYLKLNFYIYLLISILVLTSLGFILLLYFNLSLLKNFLHRFDSLKKYFHYTDVLGLYTPRELAKILMLSAFRYCIFSFQYFLILRMMDVHMYALSAFVMISMTYLVMAIPTFALTELGLRSMVALQFIGLLSSNETGIISASFLIYLLNVAFPSLIGAGFVFNLKFFRNAR